MFGKSILTFKPDSILTVFFKVKYYIMFFFALSCLKTLRNKQVGANLRYYYSDSLWLVHILIGPY